MKKREKILGLVTIGMTLAGLPIVSYVFGYAFGKLLMTETED